MGASTIFLDFDTSLFHTSSRRLWRLFFSSPVRFSILSSARVRVAPGRPGACDCPLAVKRCKLGLGLHPRQRCDRSLFRAIFFPTRRVMSSRSDSSAAFSFANHHWRRSTSFTTLVQLPAALAMSLRPRFSRAMAFCQRVGLISDSISRRMRSAITLGESASSSQHSSVPKRTRALSSRPLPPPALCECRHRGLACRLVAMRWPTVFVMAEGQRPHPRRTNRRGVDLKDAADYITVGQHIVIVITPLTGRSACRGGLEGQIVLVHFTEPTCGASFDHLVGAG